MRACVRACMHAGVYVCVRERQAGGRAGRKERVRVSVRAGERASMRVLCSRIYTMKAQKTQLNENLIYFVQSIK